MEAVVIDKLTKNFGGNIALDNVTLNIPRGKVTGIIGADGSGKTTLLRIIVGLLQSNGGTIRTLGFAPAEAKEMLAKKIGYMPQKFGLYEDLTVAENLHFFAAIKGASEDLDELLSFIGLSEVANRLVGKLSGGMKQKLGLACALLGAPELLVLDEPSVGVDPISRKELMHLVHSSGVANGTVVWSTSYLDEANSFDNVIVLDQGRVIYSGKPENLGTSAEAFEEEVIRLMGGYQEKYSSIAFSYNYREYDVEYAVEALSLSKMYGAFTAVKNGTFSIKRGEIFGLLGPNGAGKSTSFKMMCGLIRPTSGTTKIMGADIRANPTLARSYIGYMSQKFSLYGSLSVRENLEFFAGIYGISISDIKSRARDVAFTFGLDNFLEQPADELPLGLKQSLSFACALIHNPPILFLDEPTSGVDVITRREFWNHLRALAAKGVTVLITTHFMDEAELCDRAGLFYKGEIIAMGTPEELKLHAGAETMQEAFVELIMRRDKEEAVQ